MKNKKELTEKEIKSKKIRKIVIWAIIAAIALGIIAYCLCNPGEVSGMTGGELNGI